VTAQDLIESAAQGAEQIEQAARFARGLDDLPDRERVENIVVIGVGGSGVAGDVLAATAAPFIPVPITVVKGYELPAFVGEGSLVFAMSFSGDTDETVETASAAAVQGARVVTVSSGGKLCDLAASWGTPIVRVPKSFIDSRSAVGPMAVAATVILEDIGLFPGASQWIDLAVEQLSRRSDDLTSNGNIALELARKLINKAVVLSGGGSVGFTAAEQWQKQINNNARSIAFASKQPELSHNEINGWAALSEWSRDRFAVITLRHDDEHPQISRRFELAEVYLKDKVALIESIQAQGEGDLAQLLDLIMIGDFVSLHMAAVSNVDPSTASASDEIRQGLGNL
jgi:glucose/mannose-6-phosphate isomerase